MDKYKVKKMDIAKKLHQDFVIDKIKATDWTKGTDGPLIVELDTTEACDMACPGCVSEEIMEAGKKFSSTRLMELAEEFKEIGVKGVVLIGGGEPLAHPKIGDFINYLGENNIAIGITTNGSFTITLPATPNLGDIIKIIDDKGTFDTNPLTIDGNGNTIEGDDTLQDDVKNNELILIFANSEWKIL